MFHNKIYFGLLLKNQAINQELLDYHRLYYIISNLYLSIHYIPDIVFRLIKVIIFQLFLNFLQLLFFYLNDIYFYHCFLCLYLQFHILNYSLIVKDIFRKVLYLIYEVKNNLYLYLFLLYVRPNQIFDNI